MIFSAWITLSIIRLREWEGSWWKYPERLVEMEAIHLRYMSLSQTLNSPSKYNKTVGQTPQPFPVFGARSQVCSFPARMLVHLNSYSCNICASQMQLWRKCLSDMFVQMYYINIQKCAVHLLLASQEWSHSVEWRVIKHAQKIVQLCSWLGGIMQTTCLSMCADAFDSKRNGLHF